ncbi:MAG: hypothetical protein M1833_000019 [Piccolia ochrophora]|nr:MAG: hypothetical protein M1833_000019 [Piccolia ochrophora]
MSTKGSSALVRSSSDTELMPPPPTKRIKRPPKVLDEDTYTDAVSEIIARDFFPGLLESDTQQEYLDALDSENRAWIASAGRRLTQVMTPGPRRGRRGTSLATPRPADTPRGYGGDTPMSVVSDASTDTTATQKPPVDTNMSLDAFQAKYTSEDNESFNKLLDKQNRKRAEKYAWLWAGNKIPAARQIAHRARETKLLESRAAQEREDGGRQLSTIEAPDTRKAMPDTWTAQPDNQLMFRPDGIEDTHETVQQRREAESRAPPKAVNYPATRLVPRSTTSSEDPSVPPSPSLSTVRDALAGRPRPTDSEPGYTGADTPRVNGYAFVDDEPTPSELDVPSSDPTPHLLPSSDPSPNPFKLSEQSRRESLHHRMVDRVARNKRISTSTSTSTTTSSSTPTSKTPVPKFASSPRIGGGSVRGTPTSHYRSAASGTRPANLTPAAQRLWSRVGTPSRQRNADGKGVFDEGTPGGRKVGGGSSSSPGLKFRWTPTSKGVEEGGK